MKKLLSLALLLFGLSTPIWAQKMLLLEKANRVKTQKIYIGQHLRYRLTGKEDYWYYRELTEILPEQQTVVLDFYPVKLEDISMLRVHRRSFVRGMGNGLIVFGANLALATTAAAIFRDDVKYGPLYGGAALSIGTGFWLSSKRTLKMGKKYRLRATEVRFNR